MIRVFIVDDHELIREGLRKVLKPHSDIKVIGEATSAEELLAVPAKKLIDVLVLDLRLRGRSGLETLPAMKKLHPTTRTLVLSALPEERFAVRALKAGASGFVTKETVAEELVTAIRLIASGKTYASSSLTQQLIDDRIGRTSERGLRLLSNREFEILLKIASGKTIGRIASELSLSVYTIATYRARLLKKMRMKTNAELIRFALETKLLE